MVLGTPGDALTAPTGLTRTNYTRDTANDGWDIAVPATFTGIAGSTTTYTAQWIADTYTVTFDQGANGTIQNNPVVQPGILTDAFATAPAVTANAGFTFMGWTKTGDTTVYTSAEVNAAAVTADVDYTAVYEADVTVSFDAGNDGAFATANDPLASQTIGYDTALAGVPAVRAKNSRYTFLGWTMNGGTTKYSDADVAAMTFKADTAFTAEYQQTTVPGGSNNYSLSFQENGGSAIEPVSAASGTVINLNKYVPTREGYTFQGWYTTSALNTRVTSVTLNSNMVVYAKWAKTILAITDDHFAYMHGYTNGLFGPSDNITRAQAAQMLYNLLADKTATGAKSFSDVSSNAWYYTAVRTLSAVGVINGYSDGSFKPDQAITRAEFVTMIARFADVSVGGKDFSDVPDDYWAYMFISSAASKGWINGYADGTFRPTQSITRAEAATVTNNMLGREPDLSYINSHASINKFPDVTSSYWAYYDIMEATVGHNFDTDSGTEEWTSLK